MFAPAVSDQVFLRRFDWLGAFAVCEDFLSVAANAFGFFDFLGFFGLTGRNGDGDAGTSWSGSKPDS